MTEKCHRCGVGYGYHERTCANLTEPSLALLTRERDDLLSLVAELEDPLSYYIQNTSCSDADWKRGSDLRNRVIAAIAKAPPGG